MPIAQVITGLSFVLTLFIMSPVVGRMYQAAGNIARIPAEQQAQLIFGLRDGLFQLRDLCLRLLYQQCGLKLIGDRACAAID